MKAVVFQEGRNGDPIAWVEGKVAFAARRGPIPHVGEGWTISATQDSPSGKAVVMTLGERLTEVTYYEWGLLPENEKTIVTLRGGSSRNDGNYFVYLTTSRGKAILDGLYVKAATMKAANEAFAATAKTKDAERKSAMAALIHVYMREIGFTYFPTHGETVKDDGSEQDRAVNYFNTCLRHAELDRLDGTASGLSATEVVRRLKEIK